MSRTWPSVLTPAGALAGRWSRWFRASVVAGLALAFDLAYGQAPLYYSNQNQYFLHGFASAGSGDLSSDWLARTRDPTPVTSWLVHLTTAHVDSLAFHAYHLALLGLYIYALVGIGWCLFRLSTPVRLLTYIAILFVIHSPHLPGNPGQPVRPVGVLTEGFAEQYVLGPIFQPSLFGVLLVLSVYLFLRRRTLSAVVCAAAAATFHPTYLVAGGLLIVLYAAETLRRDRDPLPAAFQLGVFGLLVAPIIVYTVLNFAPGPGAAHAHAADVLVHFRIPHHADPSVWFRKDDLLRAGVVIAGLVVTRGTRVFPIVAGVALFVGVGTGIQMFSGSNDLALLFPWRPSVVLVPICSAVLSAWLVQQFFDAVPRLESGHSMALSGVALVAVFGMTLYGARDTLDASASGPESATMSFVRKARRAGDRFLVPVGPRSSPFAYGDLESFRLRTGAAILVDFKSIPYEDREVREWYRRIRLAAAAYGDGLRDCGRLRHLERTYGITAVVAPSSLHRRTCSDLRQVYRSTPYSVFRLLHTRRKRAQRRNTANPET